MTSIELSPDHVRQRYGPRLILATPVLVIALALFAPGDGTADWTTSGVHISPSTAAQTELSIAPGNDGGVYLAWVDARAGYRRVFLHQITAEGDPAPGWPSGGGLFFGVPYNPMVLADGAGGVYVAAADPEDHGSALYLSRVTNEHEFAPGWAAGGLVVPATSVGFSRPGAWAGGPSGRELSPHSRVFAPILALASDGGPLLAWQHWPRAGRPNTQATRFTSTGETMANWGLTVGYLGASNDPPAVCSDGTGGIFVASAAWMSDSVRVAVHHIALDATKEWYVPASSASMIQGSPGLVPDGAGGAYVAWQDGRNAPIWSPFIQRVMSDGGYAPGWPAEGIALSTTSTEAGTTRHTYRTHLMSSVASDGAGGAYVAWTDFRNPGYEGDIYAQHVLADGRRAPGWPDGGLRISQPAGDQRHPTVCEDGTGGLLVAWEDHRGDSYDIYAQRIDFSGQLPEGWTSGGSAVCTADSAQELPQIIGDGAGGAIIAWVDHRDGWPQIYAQRLERQTVSTLASLVSIDATRESVRLVWHVGGLNDAAVDVERRSENDSWRHLGRVWPDPSGLVTVVDGQVTPGARYGYRLLLDSGRTTDEVLVEIPSRLELRLESPQPNPTDGDPIVVFTLPDDRAARLDVVDVAGRTVLVRDLSPLGAGRHVVRFGDRMQLAPGFYVVRLVRDDRVLTRRMLVTR